MTDPASALAPRVQAAIVAALGDEFEGADPVIRPFTLKPKKGQQAVPAPAADLQINAAMALAKRAGRPPREVAQAIVDALREQGIDDLATDLEVAGPGFVNVTLADSWVADAAQDLLADDRVGVPTPPAQVIPLDYSSPNVAKEMHVGHLRTTVVGDSLARTLERLGHRVVRQNHIGDWGTPFGMLVEHLLEVGEASEEAALLETDPNEFYKAANAKYKASKDDSAPDSFAARARKRVTLLQSGDPDTLRIWERLLDRSKAYFNRVYTELGVTLTDADLDGESRYNDELGPICEDLERTGVAEISDGALCVFLDGFTGRDGQPLPVIVRKSDGGYGYATTDIAALRHRSLDLDADRVIYVVGAPQNLHFRMVWAATRKAGWLRDKTEPLHVQIGNVLGTDGKILRTRSGDLVSLQSLVDAAIEKAGTVVAESRPDLDEQQRASIAEAVGVGAIKYADLSVSHDSEYVFDLDRMVALTGNTGPYLQYAAARIRSILRRADAAETPGPIVLTEPAERTLALRLLDYGKVVAEVGESLEPHRLAAYLFDLAQAFTGFYEQCPVLKAEPAEVKASRLALCALTLRVLVDGLSLLGISAPEEM
ncbi:arginine--tRNA ligase [Barrientosiimonas endolithica]|uniref:Arginine--tRNA ligase n=1 Tax=Barrientosiimonas endolithica TaxID=1535208 RepID=A0ABM8H6E1_9MICO|nr:arginine--tRNA ligase [Barrientosiimonas endolithica]BDZ56350.1 arginine--tRNA ligase [Barrientosiimonas endolithica]BDZ60183.1 arginine--tRNA ligase [Barrientosiimonas endolithica]